MALTLAERVNLRNRVKKLLPQMKKSEIFQHLSKEGISRSTVYNTINRLGTDKPIEDDKRGGRSTSWTLPKKTQLWSIKDWSIIALESAKGT